jgi:hypothetical protein
MARRFIGGRHVRPSPSFPVRVTIASGGEQTRAFKVTKLM